MNFLISLKRKLHRSSARRLNAYLPPLGIRRSQWQLRLSRAKSKAPAAASGDLAIYTAWDERDINALIAGFNKVYPNVKVSAVRSEGGRGALLERLLTEIDSGKSACGRLFDGHSRHERDASARRAALLPLGERIQYRSALPCSKTGCSIPALTWSS